MRASHRKALAALVDELQAAAAAVEQIQGEAQEDYDDKGERWQESERGEAAMEEIGELEDAFGQIEGVVDLLLRLVAG
jgi:hypothetical protein